jgi:hypothetical protein
MNEQKRIVELTYKTYKSIYFESKYNKIYTKYHLDIDTIMSRMNKKENLNVIKKLGYVFKIFTPGQYYEYEENFGNVKLALSCQISKGLVIPYIYVYVNNENINYRYGLRNNLGFVYKQITNDFEQIVNALGFRNYEDLKGIMAGVIGIYEDFKKEFLPRMEKEGYSLESK